MSVELIKKPITLDEMTRKESTQVIKERDIIVPDGKPDMQTVLQIDGKIIMDQIDVSQDRIMYRGKVNITILYTAPNNPSCICTMKGSIPIDDFMIMEGVDRDQRVDFEYNIEHISYNILNERKINVKSIIQIESLATRCNETTIITNIETDSAVETMRENIEIVSLDTEKEDKVIVKEDLTVAQNKPSIGEILSTRVQVQEEQVKRTETEIKYNGMLEVMTMYKASGNEDNVEIIAHRIPFEGTIDNVKEDNEVFWNCTLDVEPSYMQVTPDYDGEDRVIESEFIVTAKYSKYTRENEEFITDIYCPGKKVAMKENQLEYMNLFNRTEFSVPRKEAVGVDHIGTDDMQVFSIDIKPTVEEKEVLGDRLNLKGILEMKLVGLVPSQNNAIITAMNVVPFTQELDIKGMTDKSFILPKIQVKDVKVYSQTKKEVVIEYLLDCVAEVYTKNVLDVVEEVSLEDMTKDEIDHYPSMTVYQVRKGDSLWELAKRFNTTVSEIQALNDLDSTDALKDGQKIIILKKVKF